MKAVLISIQPKWVEKIASGEKKIEVRKTKPKLQPPFKVYIYCTKPYTGSTDDNFYIYPNDTPKRANGKVVGEFICDSFDEFTPSELGIKSNRFKALYETRLTVNGMLEYLQGKTGYGWHISDLKIYDEPKELSEFKRWNRTEENSPCANAKYLFRDCKECTFCNLKRPPQSWCYVEELRNG